MFEQTIWSSGHTDSYHVGTIGMLVYGGTNLNETRRKRIVQFYDLAPQ